MQFLNDFKPQILQKYHPGSDSSRTHLNFEQREKLKEYFEEDRFLAKFSTLRFNLTVSFI